LPGMVVLQFGFDPDQPNSVHRPENHAENRIVYTGTHDHNTARGWHESTAGEQRSLIDAAIAGFGEHEPWWGLIRLAMGSPARIAMVQVQDVIGLGSEGRMNTPSVSKGAWQWRLQPGMLTPALARRLRDATEESGRLAGG